MGIERMLKRKKQHEVRKMYEKEMRKMAAMTEEQKVNYLTRMAEKIYPDTIIPEDINLNYKQDDE
jgi:HD superfamily phosphohydrolase YqeK